MSPFSKEPASTPEPFNPDGRDEVMDPMARYLAYASRVGRALSGVSRYSAYASDVGEAFRPVAHPMFVTGTYAIAFGYVGCDILYNGYRASEEGRDVRRAVAHATVFQGLASLAAPFAIIHTTVSAAGKVAARTGSKAAMRYGPTVAGLAWIPFLPSLVDEPIEELVHEAFHTYWPEEEKKGTLAAVKEAASDMAANLKTKVA